MKAEMNKKSLAINLLHFDGGLCCYFHHIHEARRRLKAFEDHFVAKKDVVIAVRWMRLFTTVFMKLSPWSAKAAKCDAESNSLSALDKKQIDYENWVCACYTDI